MSQNQNGGNWLEQLVNLGRQRVWEEQKMQMTGIIAGCIWIMLSLIAWIYVFTAGIYGRLLAVELISNGIVFLLSLFWICKIGYEDRMWRNIWVTFFVTAIITMTAMYIGKVEVLRPAQTAQGVAMYYIVQFVIYLLIDVVMAAIPVLINCMVMYIIVRIFGKPIEE